jgi:hypothetical protein
MLAVTIIVSLMKYYVTLFMDTQGPSLLKVWEKTELGRRESKLNKEEYG